MIKIVDSALALALAVLLTWLLIRGLGPSDPQTQAALQALDHYAATQSALHRDVLRARAGLLRNYDAIVEHSGAMERDLRSVRDNLEHPGSVRLLAPIAADFREQERLTEYFKSGNALLQNSLSYFGLFSSRLLHARADDGLARSVESLSGEMLHLTLDTSDASIRNVGSKLQAVRSLCHPGTCPGDVESLVAHAGLLHDLLPKVDLTLAVLVDTDRNDPVQRLRAHLREREQAVESASVRFRLSLYAASLLLLLLLFKGEVQLRARAADLHRQVALEHAVASLSAALIGGVARTTTLVQAGVEQLARTLGAKRAYFYQGRSGAFYAWPSCAKASEPAPALELARRLERIRGGIVRLRVGGRGVGPDEAALLRSLNASEWIAVLRNAQSGPDRFLAFEFDGVGRPRLPRQLTVLRTAFDAICLAFDHEEAEAARQRLAEQLSHARRMETIGAFTSGIAHNFNNLIGAINGYAEMAQSGLPHCSKTRRHIDQIQLAAERGRSLIDGLLDYGRRREQRREPVDLKSLVEETRNMVAAALGPTYPITIRHCADQALVMIDPAQVQQVLLNLCRNAAQATEDGGEIGVETATCTLTEPLLHPHGPVPAGRYAMVTVRDSGSGISPANLRRLFEPFYTTKALGNGLGLATAREIIVEFGGVITIDSRLGRGTDGRIWLPLLDAAPLAPSPAAQPECSRGSGEQILLMVDEPERRFAAEDIVAALGYEPIGVEAPTRLLEIVSQQARSIDAMLICLTEITDESCALLAELRARCPDVPLILGIESPGQVKAPCLAEAGVSAIFQGPPRPAEVSAMLQRCLRNRPEALKSVHPR